MQLQIVAGPVLLPNSAVLAAAVRPMLTDTVDISDVVETALLSGPADDGPPGRSDPGDDVGRADSNRQARIVVAVCACSHAFAARACPALGASTRPT